MQRARSIASTIRLLEMAHLLGSKTCIDSLRVDIDDLQSVIYDIIGKTGSLKCHSWKYPDKLATDVDIKDLLERYQHGFNEIDNQVSHIVLFEIIIDRLLLVIHGSWHYLHEIQNKLLPNSIDSSSTVNFQTSLSIGLVIKKYWNKLLHLFTLLQQHESHRKRPNPTGLPPRNKSSPTNDQYSQTFETTFGPCPSCAKFQQHLHSYSDGIINLCHIYNLPSSLAHYRCSSSSSPTDIENWFDAQLKDFDRLSKHIEYLNSTLNKTQDDLNKSENQCKQLNETIQQLQQSIQNEKDSKKALENLHTKKLNQIKKDNEQCQSTLNEQIQLLTTQNTILEEKFKTMTEQYQLRTEQLDKLELMKTEFNYLTENQIKSDELIKNLEQDRVRLQTELDVVKRDLDERNRDLQKERMRIENMIRHEENSQSKQIAFMKSYDDLSKECDSLKKRIFDLEMQRNELQKSVENLSQISTDTSQVQTFMQTNTHVLQEVASLKLYIEQLQQQLEQMNEREQNLLKNIDLNRSIQHTLKLNPVVTDMQHQMQTNQQQIDLLQQQNDALKFSLDKLRLTTRPPVITEEPIPKAKPTPLWLLNSEIVAQQAFTEPGPTIRTTTTKNHIEHIRENAYPINRWIKMDQDVNIETLSQTSNQRGTTSSDFTIKTESRPPTVNHVSRVHAPSIPSRTNPDMLNGKGHLGISTRSSTTNQTRPLTSMEHTQQRDSSRPVSSGKTRRSSVTTTYRCTNCNKSYSDKRNYDIHKLYCRT